MQRGRPGGAVLPVERRRAGARADADGQAALLEAGGDAATGLAGAAEDEDGGGRGWVMHALNARIGETFHS